jgi:AbrB family looped-hinge helix DNA binding protein
MVIMETTATADKAGRMVLPKEVRDELRLAPGDTLDLVSGGGLVTLRPSRGTGRMRKDRGVWVFSGGAPILTAETDRVLDAIRRGGRG